jgi:hypothetical protein
MDTQCLDDVSAAGEPAGRSEQYLVGWRFGDWYLQQGGDPDGRASELWSAEKASGFLDRLALGAETPKSGAAGGSAQAEPGRPDAEVSAFEVLTSAQGDTVWVNWADGSCIARFSKRFGIDVHASGEAQMAGAQSNGTRSARKCASTMASTSQMTRSPSPANDPSAHHSILTLVFSKHPHPCRFSQPPRSCCMPT